MVVDTHSLSRDTPDEVLDEAVQFAAAAGKRDKTRIVCAILHKKHYDLDVLCTDHGVQAVFQVGEEWDTAIHLILKFRLGRHRSFSAPVGLRGRIRVRRKCA